MSRFKPGDRVRIVSLGSSYMPCEDQGLVVGYTGTVIYELTDGRVDVKIDAHLMSDAEAWADSHWPFYVRDLEHISEAARPIKYAKVVPIKSERSLRRYTVGDNPWRIQHRSITGDWTDTVSKQQAYRCLRGLFGGSEYRDVRAVQPGLPLSPAS